MLAFEEMMKKSIVMPAHLMDDNEHQAKNGRNLFADFSEVAQVRGKAARARRQHGVDVHAQAASVAWLQGACEQLYWAAGRRLSEAAFSCVQSGPGCQRKQLDVLIQPAKLPSCTPQATKTYTAHDYADILDHLIKHWDINSLTGALIRVHQISSRVCMSNLDDQETRVEGQYILQEAPLLWCLLLLVPLH
jgi:Fatty acid desaturase